MKTIDLEKTVYDLVVEYPEVADIMAEIGFSEIKKPVMLKSVGKLMTIPKGAKMKNIPMERIVEAFRSNGFSVLGYEQAAKPAETEEKKHIFSGNRTEQIKDYLRRLTAGEDLEIVRKEFVENFKNVEAAEIMRAEQELMMEGTPLEEVQQLCDVHSALFHGQTREEQIYNAELEVAASLKRESLRSQGDHPTVSPENDAQKVAEMRKVDGHPLQTFFLENDALELILKETKAKIAKGEDPTEMVSFIREVAIHYAKKGDLLYPLLKVKYDISGPSNVMWTVDDEIRDSLAALTRQSQHDDEWYQKLNDVMQRAEEMIYKENNILFPLCLENFTIDEWHQIYRDSLDYAACLGVKPNTWQEAIDSENTSASYQDEIVMPGGHITIEQLTAMLNTLPAEITFVDADNINRYFNEGPKVFKRPMMAIDRDVFSCHPSKIEPMVRAIIDDFRNNRRDVVPVWMEKNDRAMLVQYMAVRDKHGKYIGTMEVVQDMEHAREHFQK